MRRILGEKINVCTVLVENWDVKRSLARPGRDWRIILKWMLKK